MCGIAGFIGPGDGAVLSAMLGLIRHRGPDDEGTYTDVRSNTWLGHRRLSILDIAGGHQPFPNEDGTVQVIFNGEIYNWVELRAELVTLGHRFRSDHSDTEVLVHGWEQWGRDLPRRLNGMFAFAVLDMTKRVLFLARDRFGEKPLYWTCRPGFFAFASELSSLACHPAVSSEPDLLSLQKFLAWGYLPAPNSYYRGTKKLPGGGWLEVSLADQKVTQGEYWRFALTPDTSLLSADENCLAEELRGLLKKAVRDRLVADVPVGVFLSGGVDSSAILAFAAQAIPPSRLKSFTIGFTEPSFDESPYARQVARHIGSDHQERQLDMTLAMELIVPLLSHLDEPLGDPSLLPTYLLSSFVREHVTVALSGDGGDELFAGYDPFKALAPARLYQRFFKGPVHRGIRRLADLLPVSQGNMGFDFKLKRTLAGLSYPPALWNPVWMSPFEPKDIAELLNMPVRPEEVYAEAIALWERPGGGDLLDKSLEFFTTFYLRDDILAKVDRASMAVSLETRAIFLDNDVVDFCQRLPNRFKFRSGQTKVILKKALAGMLPPEILQRRKKGFGIPLIRWLGAIRGQLLDQDFTGFDPSVAQHFTDQHFSNKCDRRLGLWAMAVCHAFHSQK